MDNHQSTSFSINITTTTSASTGENLGLGSSPDQAPVNAGTIVRDLGSGIEITHMNPRLYKAAANGDRDFLSKNPGQILAEVTPNKHTVLHIAAQFGQTNCVKEILKLPSSPSSLLRAVNKKGETPLHIAAREGHLDVVVALIEESAALEEELESGVGVAAFEEIMRMTNDENDTPLHEAVRYNHLDVVKFLSSKDREFTYKANNTGETPLYVAAERGFHHLVLVILETCTSPAYNGPNGRTALHAAVISKHEEMTNRILDWKLALTKEADEFGWTPLHCAAYLGYNPIVRHLLHNSDDFVIYLQIKDGNKTALHLAAAGGHLDVVKELISHSPDCCEQVDDRGWNVLHFTIMTGRLYFTRSVMKIHWLRVRGLVNKKDGSGNTPLHLLADSQIVTMDFVSDSRVDKMAFNTQKLTALDILSSAEDLGGDKRSIVKELKDAKASKGPLGWRNEFIKTDPRDKEVDIRTASEIRKIGATHLIVAALIATVTFAAGFSVPGGYNDDGSDKGMAILTKKTAFKAFIVSDTIAFALSISAIFVYFYMALYGAKGMIWDHLFCGFLITNFAMLAMVAAFMTGIYAVLAPSSGLAVASCIIISCCFVIFGYFVMRKLYIANK